MAWAALAVIALVRAAASAPVVANGTAPVVDGCRDSTTWHRPKPGTARALTCARIAHQSRGVATKARTGQCRSTNASGVPALFACPVACETCGDPSGAWAALTRATSRATVADANAVPLLVRELAPIARTVLLVGGKHIGAFSDASLYDGLYVAYDDATAADHWSHGEAAILLDAARPFALPHAALAVDVLVLDVEAPAIRALGAEALREVYVESARVLAPGGLLFALGARATMDGAADVCSKPGQQKTCPHARCVAVAGIFEVVEPYANVYRKGNAASPCANEKACARFPHITKARTIDDADRIAEIAGAPSTGAGRLAVWDARGLAAYGNASWAAKYAAENHDAWIANYVGIGHAKKVLPPKREWPRRLSEHVRSGRIKRVLDAGAGTCSLDATLRSQRLRSRITLVSFGFYDCSMARVASERGSMIFQWTWLRKLPFCDACGFDLVFQAEGMHHVSGQAVYHRRQGDVMGLCGGDVSNFACAQILWWASFDNLDAALKCGGTLYIADDAEPPLDVPANETGARCWAEAGAKWAADRGYEAAETPYSLSHYDANPGRARGEKQALRDTHFREDACTREEGQTRLWVTKLC